MDIKITTSEELIEFVKNSDLSIDEYTKIVQAFYNHSFVIFSNTTKEKLLSFIEVCKENQSEDLDLPLFIGQKSKVFNITDLYNNE
jgi:hypothetical protein